MSRPGQTRPCSRADAQTRLRAASQFLTMCDLGDDDASIGNDVVATNAIHAAIAAADAICCARLKLHSASGNHQDAATLLGTVDRKLGDDLARVLGLKRRRLRHQIDHRRRGEDLPTARRQAPRRRRQGRPGSERLTSRESTVESTRGTPRVHAATSAGRRSSWQAPQRTRVASLGCRWSITTRRPVLVRHRCPQPPHRRRVGHGPGRTGESVTRGVDSGPSSPSCSGGSSGRTAGRAA